MEKPVLVDMRIGPLRDPFLFGSWISRSFWCSIPIVKKKKDLLVYCMPGTRYAVLTGNK